MESTEGKVITCNAVVVKEPNKPLNVEVIEVACPQKKEVRIKMVAAGVCHTDCLMLSTVGFNNMRHATPFVPGHEGAGIVESVGEGVNSVKPGDKVLTTFIANCQQCKSCKSKKSTFCEDTWGETMPNVSRLSRSIGYDGNTRFSQNGKPLYHAAGCSSFSEYVVCPESSCVKVNPKTTLEKACILACGFSTGYGTSTKTIDIEPGDNVAIWGLDCLGLAAIVGCKDRKAGRIIGIDINSDREEIGRKMGITDFINPNDVSRPLHEVIVEMTNGGGVDFAVTYADNTEDMEAALLSTKVGGTYVSIGFGGGSPLKIHPRFLFYNRTIKGTVFGDMKAKDDLPQLAERYVNGSLPLDDFITHTFKLDEINEAFELLKNGKSVRSVILM